MNDSQLLSLQFVAQHVQTDFHPFAKLAVVLTDS